MQEAYNDFKRVLNESSRQLLYSTTNSMNTKLNLANQTINHHAEREENNRHRSNYYNIISFLIIPNLKIVNIMKKGYSIIEI